ncbi:MAG: FlgD immunoglobulin-like domain containing protein [Candidatus Kapaibacterium sp.]
MKKSLLLALASVMAVAGLWLLQPTDVEACGGTSNPPRCNRTIWLGKSVPHTVAIRPDGSATITMVLLPYISWDRNCPNPNAASLSISLRCLPVGGGQAAALGPITVQVGTPSQPGRQRLANGTNTFTLQAPAGTFNPSIRYRCLITGTYNVGFPSTPNAPLPSPIITGVGDATVCMVPESPLSKGNDIPELSVRQITPDNSEFLRCRRGDQGLIHVLVENNHPTQSVTLDLTSVGRQTAGLPLGFSNLQAAYDSSVSAISNPTPGTDVFPVAFADTMAPSTVLPDGDPSAVDPQELNRTITLGPCESRIITIAIRSHGMCADGSCNERDMIFAGTWQNGDSAIGCASTMLLVESVKSKTPLCEVLDELKVSDSVQARFSSAQYVGFQGQIEHASTHFAGNVTPREQVRATDLAGSAIPVNFPLPTNAADYIRTPEVLVNTGYVLQGRALWLDLVPFQNNVTIFNLNQATKAVEIPYIVGSPSQAGFNISYNAGNDSITVLDGQGKQVFRGTLTNLKANPPRGLRVDVNTCRRFTKRENYGGAPWLVSLPKSLSKLLSQTSVKNMREPIQILEGLREEDIAWDFNVRGSGVNVERSKDNLAVFVFEPQEIQAPANRTAVIWTEFTSKEAINTPLLFPIAVRVKPLPEPLTEITLEQVDFIAPFNRPNSHQGIFSATYDPVPRLQFLNVVARRPGVPRSESWIVQNMPLMPFSRSEMVTYWFDLADLGLPDGVDVELLDISVTVGDDLLTAIPASPLYIPIDVGDFVYDVYDGAPELTPDPFRTTRLPEIKWPKLTTVDTVYRGCNVPNIDLDSSRFNPTSRPGYAGDKNACGPAAASNSLVWLQRTHPKIDSSLGHRDMTEELSKLMGRQNELGVNTLQLVRGKLALIDKYKLPIRVKFQSKWFRKDTNVASPDTTYRHEGRNDNGSDNAWPTWDYFWGEMNHGEDVEILFGWYDSTGTRRGGHWVVASGAINLNGQVRRLWVKDDKRQRDSGGTRQQLLTWDTTAQGIPVLRGWANTTRELRIESVVSESYDSTITFPNAPTEGIRFSQFNFVEPFNVPRSPLGKMTWTTEPGNRTRFLNVYARKTLDDPPVWLVRNMVLPPFSLSEEIDYWIDFTQLGFARGERVEGFWMLPEVNDEVLVAFTPGSLSDKWEEHTVSPFDYAVGSGYTPNASTVPGFGNPPSGGFGRPARVDSTYRGCTIPNIDLDSSRNRPSSSTGYAGDWNACAPAGCANSLEWLIANNPNLNLNRTHREKLEELSALMKRTAGNGAGDQGVIEAKLAFIDRHKLPIHVKFQCRWLGTDNINSPDTTGSNGDPNRGGYGHKGENRKSSANDWPTWSFLENEMKNNEDVELGIIWYTRSGRPTGKAHIVTASGVSTANGRRRIWFKDDQDQRRSGGMSQTQATWDTTSFGAGIIPELSLGDTIAYISSIFSESYDPSVRFDTIAGTSSVPVIGNAPDFKLTILRNPSSSSESVEFLFTLPRPADAEVVIYDLLGHEIYSLPAESFEAGIHRLEWNGREEGGAKTAAGTYFVVLRVGDAEQTARMVRE